MNCRWVATDQPRALIDRHQDHCGNASCPGCLPCTEPHCRVCGRAHAEHTCAECVAEARADLREIGRLCDALPTEVKHRGVNGEAMMLLAPVADPESIGHVQASIAAGRLPADWLEHADGELHPLSVTWWWNECYREAFDHDEAEQADLGDLIEYLDRNLYRASSEPDVPFEDLARDLRRSRGHLEAVLHDGVQRDTGAPCMKCRVPLEREWGKLIAADGWRCPRCGDWRSETDYMRNVAELHLGHAEWLTDKELQVKTGVSAGTIRKRAERGEVAKKRDSGRTVYRVADVVTARATQDAG